jgi:hypothetical protein
MKKILTAMVILTTLVFADSALDDELIDNVCDIKKVKELISKGADKNVMVKDDLSLYAHAAAQKNCGESAQYLSSIGAKDVGLVKYLRYESSAVAYYPANVTFEDKRKLRVTINNVGLSGDSRNAIFENKDKYEYVYILAVTVDVDGEKYTENCNNCYIGFNNKKKFGLPFYIDTNKFPKVVKNKVSFTRQVTIKYKLGDKTYELKSPKMKENIDVKYQNYTNTPFLF